MTTSRPRKPGPLIHHARLFRRARLSGVLALVLAGAGLAAPGFSGAAQAQFFNRPAEQSPQSNETAELLLRVDRLENQIRTLNGQIEQMQFQVRRTEEMMKKFQQDVDFRFQEQSGAKGGRPPGKRSEATPDAIGDLAAREPAVIPAPVPETRAGETRAAESRGFEARAPEALGAPPVAGASSRAAGRGDAFDPAANPDAPGAPRPLGSIASGSSALPPATGGGAYPSGPLGAPDDPNAPLDLSPAARGRRAAAPLPSYPAPSYGSTPAARPQGQSTAAIVPAAPPRAAPASPKEEFDAAYADFHQGQYDAAETGLKAFLQRNPKDRLSGEAVFYLGEIYFKRGRHRDAAEQYLKISTDYPKTAHAADALVRLGVSLDKLGAKEQACAFFNEVGRKYPGAVTVKASAQREARRIQC